MQLRYLSILITNTAACFGLTLSLRMSHCRAETVAVFLYKKLICSPKLSVLTVSLNVLYVDCVWNVMTHAQKTDFVFQRNGRVHLNQQGRQSSWLLAGEVCVSAVVLLDTPCSEVVWRVLDTHSIYQFSLHFPSRASPCAITFQLEST
jgi:hypothetical protein